MALKDLTPELLAASARGNRVIYTKAMEQVNESPWGRLIQRFPNAGEFENYMALGAVAAMSAWTGARKFTTRRQDGLVVQSGEFDLAYAVPMIDIQRDNTGRHTSWFTAAGERAANYLFPRVRRILANGTSTSIARCWDDKPLFSATHGKGKGTSQSNIITGAGADTLAHVQTDLGKCIAAGAQWKDDQGEYLEPVQYNTIIYPAANYTLANIFDTIAQGRPALDAPDQSRLVQAVIPCAEITGNTWYIAAGGGTARPFGVQEEMAPALETDNDFDTREQKYAVHASGEALALDWMTILQVSNS